MQRREQGTNFGLCSSLANTQIFCLDIYHVTLKIYLCCPCLYRILSLEKFRDMEASKRSIILSISRRRLNWINDRLDLASTDFLQDFASAFLHASLSYSFTWECDKLKRLTIIQNSEDSTGECHGLPPQNPVCHPLSGPILG